MTQLDKIKEVWGILLVLFTAFGGILMALVVTYVNSYVGDLALNTVKSDGAKVYINQVIDDKLTERGVAKSDKIVEMSAQIAGNKENISENKADIDRVESKAERIAQILMED